MMGITVPEKPEILEGIGDEVIISMVTLVIGLISTFLFILYRQRQIPTIHPDSEANVESTRIRLNRQSSHTSTHSQQQQQQEQGPQARRVNNGQLTCPICLGEANYAVETNCGHVYCGRCVITYWQHQNWLGAVPCPSCRTVVNMLLLNFTAAERTHNSEESNQIREDINNYNRRFSGQPRPIMDYVRDLPTLLRHAWSEFFTVGGLLFMFRLRIIICVIIAVVYFISPLDIIPEGAFGILGLLDDVFIFLLLAIYISIIYRQVVEARATRGAANGPQN